MHEIVQVPFNSHFWRQSPHLIVANFTAHLICKEVLSVTSLGFSSVLMNVCGKEGKIIFICLSHIVLIMVIRIVYYVPNSCLTTNLYNLISYFILNYSKHVLLFFSQQLHIRLTFSSVAFLISHCQLTTTNIYLQFFCSKNK